MSGKAGGNEDAPIDFNDYVSKNELRAVLDDKLNDILQQITNLAKRIEDADVDDLKGEDAKDACNHNRLNFNRRGMGGNNQGNNDPFSKTKFKIPPFFGSADLEAYLDWEMDVDQNFSSHQVPEE